MMQPPRHLDPSLLKQPSPLKPYLDNYLSHNTPEMQKDAAPLGSFSNFPLSTSPADAPAEKRRGLSRPFNASCVCPSGLNSNLNVSLDMGGGTSGGGAVGYKEPPQSRLKKLWAADPPEQNSKTGT